MIGFLCKYSCVFCGGLTNRKLDLCLPCEKELPFLENCCTKCGRELPEMQKVCGACLKISKLNTEIKVFFRYETPIDQLIANIKFGGNLVSAKVLGELMARYLSKEYENKKKPGIIIPVPLHFARLRERGYNQAIEIARPISKKLNIPIDRFNVIRTKNTLAQATLSSKKRKENIKRAFRVKKKIIYDYVAVVDDVVTTGNTINELCDTLYKSGVNRIDIWCPAKSSYSKNGSCEQLQCITD